MLLLVHWICCVWHFSKKTMNLYPTIFYYVISNRFHGSVTEHFLIVKPISWDTKLLVFQSGLVPIGTEQQIRKNLSLVNLGVHTGSYRSIMLSVCHVLDVKSWITSLFMWRTGWIWNKNNVCIPQTYQGSNFIKTVF